MKILKPTAGKANAPHVKHQGAVLALINQAVESIDADAVRVALGLDTEQLPDGAIHQIALDAGFKVEP